MGLFDRLRGDPDKKAADAVFEKIHRLLTDDQVQNSIYPPELQQLLRSGGAIDEVPGAAGEFGRAASNPIPVNGPLGELVYISNLTSRSGSQIIGHRLGSVDRIDVYEVVALDDSQWDVLFFDPYHPRKSGKMPAGYRKAAQAERFLLATNYAVATFPKGIGSAMRACTERILGVPLVAPQLRNDEQFTSHARPGSHAATLQGLQLTSQTTG